MSPFYVCRAAASDVMISGKNSHGVMLQLSVYWPPPLYKLKGHSPLHHDSETPSLGISIGAIKIQLWGFSSLLLYGTLWRFQIAVRSTTGVTAALYIGNYQQITRGAFSFNDCIWLLGLFFIFFTWLTHLFRCFGNISEDSPQQLSMPFPWNDGSKCISSPCDKLLCNDPSW